MPKSRKPSSSPESPPTSAPLRTRAEPGQSLDPATRQLLHELIDRAEARLKKQYFDSWLQTLNNPELTRQRAALIGESFAAMRGELNNA